MNRIPLLTLAAFVFVSGARADWPQFRHDAQRSGYTSEAIPQNPSLAWVHQPKYSPMPCWTGQDTRMSFDHAYHVSVADGVLYYGSSADCKVYALDAATGRERWTFFAEAPVRFAPAVWQERVYAVSDDGLLYCLDAGTGRLLWSKRGAGVEDMLLGNGRMISRWPCRGAATVHDGVLYYAAGIWPSEGISIHALDPESGESLWLNDTAGFVTMPQPHPGADAKSGVSVQGYLTLAEDTLLIPTGRAVPAAFDAKSGALRYFRLQEYRANRSDPFIASADGWTFTANDLFRARDGALIEHGVPVASMAVFPEHIVFARGTTIYAIDRSSLIVEKQTADRKGNNVTKQVLNQPSWSIETLDALEVALIGAGDMVAAGARGKVVLADVRNRRVTASLPVDGVPLGLAAAEGRLFVSTDLGSIYCFGSEGGRRDRSETTGPALSSNTSAPDFAKAAQEIIEKSGVTGGYCLDLGCGDGSLAYELAKRTQLYICAVDPDPANVEAARRALDAAGLYGSRVSVMVRDPDDSRMPNFFADLVVSGNSVVNGAEVVARDEAERVQRPYGGVICVGRPGGMDVDVRGPLKGAGAWTHQYTTPANINCSDDDLLRGPLGMLWFADNGFEMPSRHGRGPAPLFWEGRVFVEGLHGIRALNAYNGRVLWDYPIPDILKAYDQEHLNGVALTGSNICLDHNSLFVRHENRCQRLGQADGAKLAEFTMPPRPDGKLGAWGFLACDDGILFGSMADEDHTVQYAFEKSDMSALFGESTMLFAMDVPSGRILWTHTPEHSIRNNTIAVGGGRIYFIDRPIAVMDRRKGDPTEHPPGELFALDATSGKTVWRTNEDVYGTMLALSLKHRVLIMSYQPTRFAVASEVGGRIAAHNPDDGSRLWNIAASYASRLIINDSTIYAQGGAWDLLTGAPKPFPFSRSYGCGTLAGSKHMLAYRSATLGYWDLTSHAGNENYGGIRPGCWINALPVGGLLVMPEASNRCTCSYLIKATVALQPYGIRPPSISPAGGDYSEPVEVSLSADTEGAPIRYTLDGSSPTCDSPLYERPFTIDGDARIVARVFPADNAPSPTTQASFAVTPQTPCPGDSGQSDSPAE